MTYLCKDIYRLLLLKYLDPISAVNAFRTKFFHDLLTKEQRYNICVKAAVIHMSKKQTELWLNYNEKLEKANKNTHINCWICLEPVRKKNMKRHLKTRDDHQRIVDKCPECECLYPGVNGPHSTFCPFKIMYNCPNNYIIFNRISGNLDFLDTESEPCFLTGCKVQIDHHINNCEWKCKYCKLNFKGYFHKHFGPHKYDDLPLCTVYKEVCPYINCQELVLRCDYVSHTNDKTIHGHLEDFKCDNGASIMYKWQLKHYNHHKKINDDKKIREDLIIKLKQLIIDLSI